MAKSASTSITNLLRISGILFAFEGAGYLYQFMQADEAAFGFFELTPTGSLIVGVLLLVLSIACFFHSRK